MYGLLLDCIQKFICEQYGERYWSMVRRRANLKNQWFVTHEVYRDSLVHELVDAAALELGEDREKVMCMFGKYFAESIGRYGYARLLRVLGRDLRDFLNGLDDLHEYLRFSYPKMKPPSFFCECETVNGLKLNYTSKRSGYLHYVIGQLMTVGRIYGKDLEIELLSEEISDSGTRRIVLDLKFDNSEFLQQRQIAVQQKQFTVDSQTFLSVFPFCLLLDRQLVIQEVGLKICEVLPPIIGMNLAESFVIRKPMLEGVSWRQIGLHANCVFELESRQVVVRKTSHPMNVGDGVEVPELSYATPPSLRLKGQMLFLSNDDLIAFLCSPVMDSPEDLYESGIYVNDLSMHDSSRDIILAGSQKDPELTLALNQEKIRSAQLEESVQQMDRLLYQMIPKPIAMQLRNGETPLNTCKEFSSVSILFSDIVSFTPMCSRLHPMEVVCVLNAMYCAFDHLCEVHHVYKTETIGDAYMVICGAPVYTVHHAEYITDFAIAIIKAASKINDPSTNKSLKIRVGIHTGNVVAGVVGSTVIRYDVFGDTVNVASRMEATGEPMKIHVSEATAERLVGTTFVVKERGTVNVKGKGEMKTFWVTGKQRLADLPEEGSPESTPTPDPSRFLLHPSTPVESSPPSSLPPLSPPISPSSSQPTRVHPTPSPTPFSTSSPSNMYSPSIPNGRNEASLLSMSSVAKHQRALSPKPSEWPQAEQQLQKYESLAFDNSVPPGNKRRETVPYVKVESERWSDQINRRLSAPQNILNTSNSDFREQDISYPVGSHALTTSQLSPQGNMWDQCKRSLVRTTPAGYAPHIRGPLPGFAYSMHSLVPFMPHLPAPPPAPLTPAAETATRVFDPHQVTGDVKPWQETPSTSSLSLQLQQFAAQAEDSARRARQLADYTAYAMLRLQWAECNGNLPHEGTPVDPDDGNPDDGNPDDGNTYPLYKNLLAKDQSNGATLNHGGATDRPTNNEDTTTTGPASCTLL